MRSIASPSALRSLASTRTISAASPDSSSANANVVPDGARADDGDPRRMGEGERVGSASGAVMADTLPHRRLDVHRGRPGRSGADRGSRARGSAFARCQPAAVLPGRELPPPPNRARP